MSRGKYGRRAAVRREATEQEAEVSAYQHQVKLLTAELVAIKEAAKARDEAHQAEVQRLRVQVEEVTSPALVVVQHENQILREERDAAREEVLQRAQAWEIAFRAVIKYGQRHQHIPHRIGDQTGRKTIKFTPEVAEWLDEVLNHREVRRHLPPEQVSGRSDVVKVIAHNQAGSAR